VDSSGAYGYQWVEVNGACSDTDTVVISFFSPPLADAGPSANVLCDTSFTFAAVLGSGSGVWTQSLGPGVSTIANSSSPNSVVTVNTMGLYVFLWTTTDSLCSNTDTMIVNFEDPLTTDGGSGSTECDLDFTFGASTTIGTGLWTQSSGPTGGTSIFALSSDPTTSVTVIQPGSYVYTWTETLGTCVDSEDVAVIFTAPVVANAGRDTSISLGNSVDLFAQGGTTYIWSPGIGLSDTLIPNPVASPIVTTTYGLLVLDNSGCFGTDSVIVTVNQDFNFIVSNIMTPNGDGFNDTWYIDNIEFYPECDVAIYNRYGNQLYSVKGYQNDWKGKHNGKDLPDGTYYYVLKCPGTTAIFKGGITIFRRR
ncbi:MAG TPA: gliding motility-associated C-terminal domain-containing protein, partial [Flavobacteriales bacterium]|nr:gliding motility-associated C-terminal domain-containing protein [Flavobacteriales bacterium]